VRVSAGFAGEFEHRLDAPKRAVGVLLLLRQHPRSQCLTRRIDVLVKPPMLAGFVQQPRIEGVSVLGSWRTGRLDELFRGRWDAFAMGKGEFAVERASGPAEHALEKAKPSQATRKRQSHDNSDRDLLGFCHRLALNRPATLAGAADMGLNRGRKTHTLH
jgi:hypothetical protein